MHLISRSSAWHEDRFNAAMVGKTIGNAVKSKEVPVYISRFGRTIEDIFVTSTELKHRFGSEFDAIPPGAIGLFTYMQRIAQGMRQLMAGNRKFGLLYITRDDIAALTKDDAEISGIPYIMDVDADEVEGILNG